MYEPFVVDHTHTHTCTDTLIHRNTYTWTYKYIHINSHAHTQTKTLSHTVEEDGWTIVRIPTHPETTVGSRLAAALTPDTSAVMTSAVFFLTGRMAGELDVLARAARGMDVPLLVDVYHVLGGCLREYL